jgi:hypothetical protein
MATDLTVMLEDKAGELASLGETAGNAGINLAGGCGVTSGGRGEIHLLVEGDAAAAAEALHNAGVEVAAEREVLVIDVNDQPGELGAVARRLGDAGVNIELFYLATGTRLVLGADDLERARSAVS